MKAALCFLISYKHIVHKERLWIDWIKPNQDIINVYFHYHDLSKIKSKWIRAHTIPPDIVQSTSYFNVVPAYMALLSYAFDHDKDNQWFCMLTESCVPILSPAEFRKRFLHYYSASIIRCRSAYWDITLHRRANLRLLSKEFWLANDPWFVLCRNHVHKCILFVTYYTGVYKQINQGGLANESVFAIILQTFYELDNPARTLNAISTLTDWTRMSSPTSPYVFRHATPENVQCIQQMKRECPHALFLRKVDAQFPDKVLKQLMDDTSSPPHVALHDPRPNVGAFFAVRLVLFVLLGLFNLVFWWNVFAGQKKE